MKKPAACFLVFCLPLLLSGQAEVQIKENISFRYMGMEFEGSHSQISEKVPLFIQEIQKQNLLSEAQGDIFGVFFDSALLGEKAGVVYCLGVRILEDTVVEAPLMILTYEHDKAAVMIHSGPYETVANAFNIILPFIEENGWEISGPPLELWMGDPRRDKPEDLKTRIFIPVKK